MEEIKTQRKLYLLKVTKPEIAIRLELSRLIEVLFFCTRS